MKKMHVVFVLGAALLVASGAYAGPLADATADTLWGIQLGGYLDASYTYSFNDPDESANSIGSRAFATDDNQIQLDAFQLYIDKLPQDEGEAGFRFDILAGEDAEQIGDLWGGDDDIAIYQAFISYIAPVGNGLTIDVGRFATWHGYEAIESPANDQFTRSAMFTMLQPYTHTGLRLTYPINDMWEISGGLTQGWDVVDDNNEAWTFHGAIRWMPMENVYIQNSVSYGPENRNINGGIAQALSSVNPVQYQNVTDSLGNNVLLARESDSDYTLLYDLVATWDVNESVTLGLNFDYQNNEDAMGTRDASLWGIGAYGRYNVNEDMYLALRGEWINDEDEFTGIGDDLWEITATLGYTVTEGLLTRLEYRHDSADADIFADEGRTAAGFANAEDQQDTISIEVIYSF